MKRATEEDVAAVAAQPFWYHTMDLAPGLTTPGWFDLRPVIDKLPWPDLRGKRCLDIGTFDGHLAFEMERRGAAEVVAIDIEDHLLWDWPPDARPTGPDDPSLQVAFRGFKKGDGFRVARQILGSSVEWRPLSIYDLTPAEVGMFDVVTVGTLLLHLRDPVGALEAVRRVCRTYLLSSEQIELWLSVFGFRRPLARLDGSGPYCQWWVVNASGHLRMLYAAGFAPERVVRPFVVRFNEHPPPEPTIQTRVDALARWALTGTRAPGVLHRAVLARPRL